MQLYPVLISIGRHVCDAERRNGVRKCATHLCAQRPQRYRLVVYGHRASAPSIRSQDFRIRHAGLDIHSLHGSHLLRASFLWSALRSG